MIQGLERIASLLRLYKIRESLYIDQPQSDLSTRNLSFENAVLKTYYHILGFQARLISHLWKSPGKRLIRNTLNADDWEAWLVQVDKSDAECLLFTSLLDKGIEQMAWDKQYSQADSQISIQTQILASLEYARREQRVARDEDQQRKLLHTLTSDYEEQKNINPTRVPGTCEWFLNSKEFLDWRNADNSRILWVSAGPGCGKSVLSRCLIDEARVTTSVMASTACYFFFKDGQEGQMSSANALKAITHQLLTKVPNPDIMEHALPRFRAHGDKIGTMFNELWHNLITTVIDERTGEVVCILDALDECAKVERGELLEHLIDFFSGNKDHRYANARLKFLITSRPESDIEARFARLDGAATFIQLDADDQSDQISKEVNLVIDDRIPRIAPRLGREAQQEIANHLKRTEHRTYLWLHLILNVIEDKIVSYGTAKGLKPIIDHLPATVHDAYERILSKSTDPASARNILLIIIGAKRPFTVSEMNVALGLTRQDECTSYETLDRPLDTFFKSSVKQICGLLVSVHHDKVYLLHQTVRDFLIWRTGCVTRGWQYSLIPEQAELVLSRVCVRLLSFSDFDPPPWKASDLRFLSLDRKFNPWIESHTLFRYACVYWAEHCRTISSSPEDLLGFVMQLCKTSGRYYKSWWPVYCDVRPRHESWNWISRYMRTPLQTEKIGVT